jgi:CelD/BcsL family acetyltransferase involved in cellulose biosynthesis
VSPARFESLSAAQLDRWRAIVAADPALASPFLGPEFTGLVAAARPDVWVAVLDGGGFFPFQRGRLGTGRPVGAGISDYQAVVAPPGLAWEPVALLRGCGLRTWEFDHLLAAQAPFAPYHRRRRSSPVIDVVGGPALAGGEARKLRKLEREHGPVRFAVHDPGAMATLLAWKSQQYVRTGAADVLARPWVRQVVEAAAGGAGVDGIGLLSTLRAGDRLVAAHLGLRSASVWHWWFPAYDPDLAAYSPGLLLLLRMVEAAPGLGVDRIDLGKGDAGYKQRLMTGVVEVAEGAVETPSLAAAVARARRSARGLARATSVGPRLRRAIGRR